MRTYKYLLVFFSFIALAVNVQAETKRDSIQQVKDMDRYVFRGGCKGETSGRGVAFI